VEQLSRSAIAVPGIIAGIGASAGTAAIGLQGMKKSVTELIQAINTDDPKALQKANDDLKQMSPNAQSAARAIATLATGPLKQLQQSVSQRMFAGMAAEINTLGTTVIPRLTTDMNGVATAWNRTLKTLTGSLSSQGNLSLIDRIFGNTATAQTKLNQAIDPLVHGMTQLAATGTDFLPRLADGVAKVSTRFDNFINKSAQNGNLDKWIDSGLTGMTKLGNAALNLGKTLENIFKAAGGGDGFLSSLEHITQRWAQFTGSTQGQAQLTNFFKEAHNDLKLWEPVLANIAKILGQIIGGAQQWSHILLPFLKNASDLLLALPGGIAGVTTAFLAWRAISGVSSLLSMLERISTTLGGLPGRARTAGAAVAEVEAAAGGGGGVAGGGRGRGSRLGSAGRLAAGTAGFIGMDQLFSGVDPANPSNRGTGGWLQSISGAAVTGGSIGAFAGPEGIAIGAAIGAGVGAAIKGISNLFRGPDAAKPLAPGALQGQDYQTALNQVYAPNMGGGAPWDQKLVNQAVYGTTGSFDPRKSGFAHLNKGDANYQATLAQFKDPSGAFSSIPGLNADNAEQMLDKIIQQAKEAGSALDSLGSDIVDLPTGEVVLKDPTPEVLARVKQLGADITVLPNGLIAINTDQLTSAIHMTDELSQKMAKLMVPGMMMNSSGTGLVPDTSPSPYATSSTPLPGIAGLLPPGVVGGHASGGIVRRFDKGGVLPPWANSVKIRPNSSVAPWAPWDMGAMGRGNFNPKVQLDISTARDLGTGWLEGSSSDQIAVDSSGIPSGGVMPGYSPGIDNMLIPVAGSSNKIAVGGGEGIVIPEAMPLIGGAAGLYRLNSAARPGLSRANYFASGGVVGRFDTGGQYSDLTGPIGPFGLPTAQPGTETPTDILSDVRSLLAGQKYGPLTALQANGLMQQQYLQRIATGNAQMPASLLPPGTTPGHLGPFGTPIAPQNKAYAMAAGALSALGGGDPSILLGPDPVKYQQQNFQEALSQITPLIQSGGIQSLNRSGNPQDYIGMLQKFSQTGVITPEMRSQGLDENNSIVTALLSAKNSKGYEQVPGYISDVLGSGPTGGFSGQLTPENQAIISALQTFKGNVFKQGESNTKLNAALAPLGGPSALPQILQGMGFGTNGIPGGGPAGAPGPGGLNWDALAGKEASGNWQITDPTGTYMGGLQFDQSTWNAYKPPGFPDDPRQASREQQIQVAQLALQKRTQEHGGDMAAAAQTLWPKNWGQLGIGQPGTGGPSAGFTPPMVLPPAAPPGTPPGDGSPVPDTGTPLPGSVWIGNNWMLNGQKVGGKPPGPGDPQFIPGPVAPPAGTPPPAVAAPPQPGGAPAAPGVPGLFPGIVGPGTKVASPFDFLPGAKPPTETNIPGKFPAFFPAPLPVAGDEHNGRWVPILPNANPADIGKPGNPGWKYVNDTTPPAEMPQERPSGPAPAGKTWDNTTHQWVPAPGQPGSPPSVSANPPAPGAPGLPGAGPLSFGGGTAPIPGMPAAPAALNAAGGLNLSTIPIAAQKYANDCIDASARIILSHAGVNMSEEQLMGVITPGGSIDSQAAGLNRLNPAGGYRALAGSGGSAQALFAAVKGAVDNGTGAILNVAPGSSIGGRNFSEGHFIAATGYNPDGTINLSDTAKGTQYSVSAEDAFQATQGRGIVYGTGTGPGATSGMPSPLAGPGTGVPGVPGVPGPSALGTGGGVVPVSVTNWPAGFGGGGAPGAPGAPPAPGAPGVPGAPPGAPGIPGIAPSGFSGAQAQQAGQIAAGIAGPVLGAAGNVISGVANDAIAATPGAIQSVFETPAGINAPPVVATTAFNEKNPVQGALAALGINVPDMSRMGATNLVGGQFEQNTGPGYDATGRLLSDTTQLYQRTSSDLDAHLVAMKDQIVGATSDVGKKLGKDALEPLLSAGVSAGMGAIPQVVLSGLGSSIGEAAAPPIANAIGKSGSTSSTASDISALPFNATAGLFNGISTLAAATGGPITGGTMGVDSVPVMAQHGEWVLTTDEVNKLGGFAGMTRFTSGLAKVDKIHGFATGGGIAATSTGGGINPGTAGTGTATLGGDFFGVSQIPIIGAIIDVLINILLQMMGIQISVRDTMLGLSDQFRQFRGDSFQAFDAQGRLMNDTSGLIDRSMTSTEEATSQRVQILTQVLEGVITYILDKVVIPMAEAVAQAAINAAASAGGGALNAIAPGAGSAVGAAASALGDAAVQVGGQVGQDFGNAAISSIGNLIGTAVQQNLGGSGLNFLLGGTSLGSATGDLGTSALAGGLGGSLIGVLGLDGLDDMDRVAGSLFDDGGVASGTGYLPKAVLQPERVLSPRQTEAFEKLVDALASGNLAGSNTTTVHAPISVAGGPDVGQKVQDSLLSLI